MQMLVYVILAVIIYALLADRTDRAIEREMKKRRHDSKLELVEDFDVRPHLGPQFGRLLTRQIRSRPSEQLTGGITDRANRPT